MANTNPLVLYNIGTQTGPGTTPKIVVPETIKRQIVKEEKKKTSLLDILSGAGTVLGNFFGAKQATQQQVQYPYLYPEEKKDNTIVIVLIVLIVVILVTLLLLKKPTQLK